jgi:hypothetical protein
MSAEQYLEERRILLQEWLETFLTTCSMPNAMSELDSKLAMEIMRAYSAGFVHATMKETKSEVPHLQRNPKPRRNPV